MTSIFKKRQESFSKFDGFHDNLARLRNPIIELFLGEMNQAHEEWCSGNQLDLLKVLQGSKNLSTIKALPFK